MATITLDPRRFMQKEYVEGIVNRQLEQSLDFINLFDVIPTDGTTVSWKQDVTTAGDDISSGLMGEPLDLGETSHLTKVEISPVTEKSGMLYPFGFKIEVSERDLKRSEVIDDLNRAVDRGTWAMARKINNDIIATMQNTTNDITEVSGAYVWSDSTNAVPVQDIISFQKAFRVDGFNHKLTDLFVHPDNFYEFKMYLAAKGYIDVLRNDMDVPAILGTKIREAATGISEGAYLGIDSRPGFRPVSLFAYRDPAYKNAETFPLVTINQYQEDKHPKNIVTEFVAEILPAVRMPNGFCYKSSGI